MRKFSLKLILFLFTIIALVMLYPVDQKKVFYGLKDDCFNHAKWMYDRLYENPEHIDIAFLGSSQTINGINDLLIDSLLKNHRVANFGYCRYGRNLTYLMAKRVLELKKVKTLVVEVRAGESAFSHPVFPHLANNTELLTNYPFFNENWFSDFATAFQYRVQLVQEEVLNEHKTTLPSENLYGFAGHYDTLSFTELTSTSKRHYIKPKWKDNLDHIFPLHYDKKLAELCKQHNVKLFFLYLPAYKNIYNRPIKMEQIEHMAPILYPPPNVLNNTNYWHDKVHLNSTGAQALSTWLAEELKSQIP